LNTNPKKPRSFIDRRTWLIVIILAILTLVAAVMYLVVASHRPTGADNASVSVDHAKSSIVVIHVRWRDHSVQSQTSA